MKENKILAIPNLLYVLIADCLVPGLLSGALMILCIGMMLLSMVLYFHGNWKTIREDK